MRNSKQLLEKEEFLIRENENHCILGYSGIPTYIFRDDEVRKVIADFCSEILFEEWDNIGEELIEIYTFEEVSEEDEAKYGVGDETPYENPVPTKEGMKKFLIDDSDQLLGWFFGEYFPERLYEKELSILVLYEYGEDSDESAYRIGDKFVKFDGYPNSFVSLFEEKRELVFENRGGLTCWYLKDSVYERERYNT